MRRHLSRPALLLVIIALACGTLAVLDASARQRSDARVPFIPLLRR